MTVFNAAENERITPHDPFQMWDAIQRDWAGSDHQRWKALACIHLRLHCRWGLDMIGQAFSHHRGHVLRLINSGFRQLREWHVQSMPDELEPFFEADEPYALTCEEIARRRQFYLDEVKLWTSLFEAARQAPARAVTKHPSCRRIVPGSLRERIALLLQQDGPLHWSVLSRRLEQAGRVVRSVLLNSPEFVCDRNGLWTVHPFAGQECEGPDTECVAPTA